MKRLSRLILMSVLAVTAWSCGKEDVPIDNHESPNNEDNNPPTPVIPTVDYYKYSLKDLAAKAGIKLGAAFTYGE